MTIVPFGGLPHSVTAPRDKTFNTVAAARIDTVTAVVEIEVVTGVEKTVAAEVVATLTQHVGVFLNCAGKLHEAVPDEMSIDPDTWR